jgi:hypothetical protein
MVHGTNYGAKYVVEFQNPVSSFILSPPTLQQLSAWRSFCNCSFTIKDFLEYKPDEITQYTLIDFIHLEPKTERLRDYYQGCIDWSNYHGDKEHFVRNINTELIYNKNFQGKTKEEKMQYLEYKVAKFRDYLSITNDDVNELLNMELELNEEQKNGLKIIMDLEKDNIKWHGWKFTSYNY